MTEIQAALLVSALYLIFVFLWERHLDHEHAKKMIRDNELWEEYMVKTYGESARGCGAKLNERYLKGRDGR